FLNGRNSGRVTPDTLIYLDYGHYQVTLKRNYFRDTSLSVIIKENEKTELFVDYKTNPGMYGGMNISSNPQGASIFINDSLINGITPFTITNILPGNYKVTVKLLNYRDGQIKPIVRSGQISNYNTILRDTSEWIDYQLINSGIQSNSLTSIAIDNNGIKWIGSTDKGLIRFDETNFINYSTLNSGIPEDAINCVTVSPDNKIWIGTTAGVGVFDGSSWVNYNNSNSGLTSNLINSIEFDEQSNAWIGSSSGLYKFDGVTWTRYNDDQLRLWVLATKIDGNKIWIGTNSDGIISLENEILSYYPDTLFFYPSKKITSIEKDNVGNIWFTHSPGSNLQCGVSFYSGNSFSNFRFGINNTPINNISIDELNNKWISTFEGLLRYDANNITQTFSGANSLISSKRVTGSAVDSNNDLWITTSGGGLNKFKVNQ
ncbi:MAG TPA: PEGA domain-containing protein, partial [Ignavibacteriaceae bacterium]|nr:PEGA domain-containing protein [Ignavibacteriaceae bacterium]